MEKSLLGKVFISHSSTDKFFVRKLTKKLERHGYQVWLDEKELIVGDMLPERISQALDSSNVILVVVSSAAVKSKWLRFELNKATQKMIDGRCRVIPIIKEKMTLPPEVQGLLYADFTGSFALGYRNVSTALKHEAMKKARDTGFWALADVAATRIFGGKTYVSAGIEYKSSDYEGFTLPYLTAEGNDLLVVYEEVSDYGVNKNPLTERWWLEYSNSKSELTEDLFIVLTQRPVGFTIDGTALDSDRVKWKRFSHIQYDKRLSVFVDLSGLNNANWHQHLKCARNILADYAIKNLRIKPITDD